ncbi:hypothetical protein [Pelagerythrobacter aerophilus]|nr:hypothetical protein [Pelagerythrobacter aerophilus]
MSIEKLKSAGGMAAGLLLMLVLLALPLMLLLGAAEISVWALDWIPQAIGIATLGCMLLIPLAIIPATRGLAASLFGLASLVFGACLWLYALAFTYLEWGMLGVVIGVLIFGVGVVVTGTLAAIFSGMWVVLGNVAFLLALFVGTRLLSVWLARLADERHMRKAARETPSEVVIAHKIEG